LHPAAPLPPSTGQYPEDTLERDAETQRPGGLVSTIELQQIMPPSSTHPDNRFRFTPRNPTLPATAPDTQMPSATFAGCIKATGTVELHRGPTDY
jgi:hypothetical protein